MDANKLVKLKEIGYSIRRCCRNCQYSVLENSPWGTCMKHQYRHLKHTGPARQLSINRDGWCQSHEWSLACLQGLDHFKQFIEKGD